MTMGRGIYYKRFRTAPQDPCHLHSRVRDSVAHRLRQGGRDDERSLGVVLDPNGQPVLPGSSLKGRLRSTCEAVAHALNLRACMLSCAASGRELHE